jgi:hypothetical protein
MARSTPAGTFAHLLVIASLVAGCAPDGLVARVLVPEDYDPVQLAHFGGAAADDFFAITVTSEHLHWDGRSWNAIDVEEVRTIAGASPHNAGLASARSELLFQGVHGLGRLDVASGNVELIPWPPTGIPGSLVVTQVLDGFAIVSGVEENAAPPSWWVLEGSTYIPLDVPLLENETASVYFVGRHDGWAMTERHCAPCTPSTPRLPQRLLHYDADGWREVPSTEEEVFGDTLVRDGDGTLWLWSAQGVHVSFGQSSTFLFRVDDEGAARVDFLLPGTGTSQIEIMYLDVTPRAGPGFAFVGFRRSPKHSELVALPFDGESFGAVEVLARLGDPLGRLQESHFRLMQSLLDGTRLAFHRREILAYDLTR